MEVKRPFSQLDWFSTPDAVKVYIAHLEQIIGQVEQRQSQLEKRTEKLEAQVGMNSQNSSKPPSTDSPYKKPDKKTKQPSSIRRGG